MGIIPNYITGMLREFMFVKCYLKAEEELQGTGYFCKLPEITVKTQALSLRLSKTVVSQSKTGVTNAD